MRALPDRPPARMDRLSACGVLCSFPSNPCVMDRCSLANVVDMLLAIAVVNVGYRSHRPGHQLRGKKNELGGTETAY